MIISLIIIYHHQSSIISHPAFHFEVVCYFVLEHVPVTSSAAPFRPAVVIRNANSTTAEEPHQAMKGISQLLLPGL